MGSPFASLIPTEGHSSAVAELLTALRPFAAACCHLHPATPDDGTTLDGFEAADFRRAAEAYMKFAGHNAGDKGGDNG